MQIPLSKKKQKVVRSLIEGSEAPRREKRMILYDKEIVPYFFLRKDAILL